MFQFYFHLGESIPSITDILQTIFAGIVMLFAGLALFSWQYQKKFDITIELLAKCRGCQDYLLHLRTMVSNRTMLTEELREKFESTTYKSSEEERIYLMNYVYESKRSRLKDTYNDIAKDRERAWAFFGASHPFYKFYDRVLRIEQEIFFAQIQLFNITVEPDSYEPEEAKEIKKESRRTISYSFKDDKYASEIESMVLDLEKHRPKQLRLMRILGL